MYAKTFLIIGLSFLSLHVSGFCEMEGKTNPFRRHHIRFGPELMVYKQNKEIRNLSSKGNRFFYGLRFIYEYIFPHSFYAGLDLASAQTEADFKAYKDNKRLNWQQANREFGNFDLRLGYTFSNKNKGFLLSSFAGFGVYEISPEDSHNQEGLKEDRFSYFSGGIRLKYPTEQFFTCGFNLKVLYILIERIRFKLPNQIIKDQKSLWGSELGIPLSWFISKNNRWNFTFEPYFLTLGFSKDQMVFGSKLLFGFKF